MSEGRRQLGKSAREKRNKLIVKLSKEGCTAEQIAAQTNLTPGSVINLLYELKKKKEKEVRDKLS